MTLYDDELHDTIEGERLKRDPKRGKRIKLPWVEWVALVQQLDPACQMCSAPAVDPHHLVLRSAGGDDVLGNLAPLCRDCHDGLHMHRPGAHASMRSVMTEEQIAYIVDKKGKGWLDLTFPERER